MKLRKESDYEKRQRGIRGNANEFTAVWSRGSGQYIVKRFSVKLLGAAEAREQAFAAAADLRREHNMVSKVLVYAVSGTAETLIGSV